MKLKQRLLRIEQALGGQTIGFLMPDGQVEKVPTGELLDCLLAVMHAEDHPLLPIVREVHSELAGGNILNLIKRFDCNEHRHLMSEVREGRGTCGAQP